MRVTPDDEVYRVNTVWHGPTGLTFPWTARYLAYATWLITFLLVLFLEAVTPLSVHLPPIWEVCITTLGTYALMGFIDHERPPKAVAQTLWADLSAPRPRRVRRTVTGAGTVTVEGGWDRETQRYRERTGHGLGETGEL